MIGRSTLIAAILIVGVVTFTTAFTGVSVWWLAHSATYWGPIPGWLVIANHFALPACITYRVTGHNRQRWVWISAVSVAMLLTFAAMGVLLFG